MSSRERLLAALDGFVRERRSGVRSKRHIVPLVEFAAAELRSRGVSDSSIRYEIPTGYFYKRKVDLVVESEGERSLNLVVLSQSGSVRKNLNNRRRDIVGDALNLRATNPTAKFGLIYLLRRDEEATKEGRAGNTPIDEMASFLANLQTDRGPLAHPLLDAAALLVADQEESGRIRIEAVPESVDVLRGFFDKLVG